MEILLAILCIALGVSFAWKCLQAVLFGKVRYWSGFLPISLISPLFIHLPSGPNSLIKTTQQWWIHVTAGPVFFLIALCLLGTGADNLGLPGTDSINGVFTGGRTDVRPAIKFTKGQGYSFPMFSQAGSIFVKMLTKPVFEEEGKKDQYSPGSSSTADAK